MTEQEIQQLKDENAQLKEELAEERENLDSLTELYLSTSSALRGYQANEQLRFEDEAHERKWRPYQRA